MTHSAYRHIGSPEDRVVEEIGEFLQALSKARRFGLFNRHPDRPHETNYDHMMSEMEDVVECFEALQVKLREIKHEHDEDQAERLPDSFIERFEVKSE